MLVRLVSLEKINEIEQSVLHLMINYSPDGLIIKTLNGIITSWNPSAERLFGYSAHEMIGQSATRLVPPERLDEEAIFLNRLTSGEKIDHFKTVALRKDGQTIPVSSSLFPIKDNQGSVIGIFNIVHDITGDKQREETEQLLTSIINSSDDAIISKTLQGIITSWNPAATHIFGYSAHEIIGKSILMLIPSDRFNEETHILEKIAAGEKIDHFETVRIRKDGKQVHVSVSISPIKNKEGIIIGASKIVRDITELTLQRYLATHDALTGLPILRLAYDRLNRACAQAKRSKTKVAVLFMDLDGFKAINDTYGHTTGDAILKIIAERLVVCLREEDTVARIGGDEFLMILGNLSGRHVIKSIVNKIIQTIIEPIDYDNTLFKLKASIGIALYPDDSEAQNELIQLADKTMYAVKKRQKEAYGFYADYKKGQLGH
ncbi:sensory box (GGDEF/EAL domain) regulatory protein [Legionella busanensis]|uniref:Sensory box (GGDEF/EAL domain) regulatory protein n=1 Tax=Legionella busanensis TaxID=190655 RepID=A0A378KCG7_9GAMM|nr:sensor domain-containing diguanylate cyclase [Legionella busanensis]STX81201.1 sensory box (GGDEF/EAL domain) regulatory protein [Legionella busanensis]